MFCTNKLIESILRITYEFKLLIEDERLERLLNRFSKFDLEYGLFGKSTA